MTVKVVNLVKMYGSQKAVDSISFEVTKGEIAGFIGPNGSGKTTTMKCICGIMPPSRGYAEIAGKEVQQNLIEIKKLIGYLPESNPLYPEMYVREYLQHIAGFYKNINCIQKRIDEIILMTGLKSEEHKKIGQLSKGYKQRVGLAQAMIHDPEVLILDEPTTGLDPNQIVEIRNLISDIAKNKTVLLSTHILQEVEAICNRVIIINQGKIIANNTASAIRSENMGKLQTIQVEFAEKANISSMKQINGVKRIKSITDNIHLIEADAEKDIRENIFQYALNNNLTLLTMQKKEETLEEVFRKLTSQS
ncbi:MAG: ATP-binding cassette domain-containing protein [Bacteroidales bacterium]|nr:ATP-binding cassette domain-containing protein [Bacteroidales bacterium]